MPIVTIQVTREGTTIIEEIETENWGCGGRPNRSNAAS